MTGLEQHAEFVPHLQRLGRFIAVAPILVGQQDQTFVIVGHLGDGPLAFHLFQVFQDRGHPVFAVFFVRTSADRTGQPVLHKALGGIPVGSVAFSVNHPEPATILTI